MALKIRLRKPGKSIKGRYHYKIVVDEARSKKEGKFVEQVGYYDPSKKPELLFFDLEKYEYWIKKGAQPTETVKSLVKRFKKRIREEKGE